MSTGSGKGATVPTSMQLNLFQWDLVEVGNGYRCFADLDFEQARTHFSRVVSALPNHQAAGEGLKAACYWQETFTALPTLVGERGVSFLWQRMRAFDFGGNANHVELRTNLLRQLQAAMKSATLEYLPPDLCLGSLSLQLGDYENAEQQLRRLIESFPEDGLLYGYLADALWMQQLHELANSLYALALLLAPELMTDHTVRNQRLAVLIADRGTVLAPIYGYLSGVVPLVEQEFAAATEAMNIYALLRQVERARYRGDHAAMVTARKQLGELAPEVFDAYLQFVQQV
jgi:tetratricopeptide (TPR) repeat protein